MLLFVHLLAAAVWPQQPAPEPDAIPPAAAAAEAASPEPIPIEEVAPQAESALLELEELRALAGIDSEMESMADELADLARSIDEDLTASEADDLGALARSDLAAIRELWAGRAADLQEQQDRLAAIGEQAGEVRARLQVLEDTWRLSSESLAQEDLPEAVGERIAAVLAGIEEIRAALPAELEALLEVQDQVSQRALDVRSLLQRIAAEQADSLVSLLELSHPPLWRSIGSRRDSNVVGETRRSVIRARGTLDQWVASNRTSISLQCVLFLVFASLFWVSHRRGGVTPEEAATDDSLWVADYLFSRPASSALLVALIASRWLHPQRPEMATDILMLFAVPAVLQLVSGLVDKKLRLPIYVVAGLLVTRVLARSLSESTVAGRMLLLLVSGLGAAAVVWFIRELRGHSARQLGGSGVWRVLAVFLPVAALAFGVSLLANLVGMVSLAAYLTVGMVESLWLATVIYLAALVLSSLVVFLSQRPPVAWLVVVRDRSAGLERVAGRFFHTVGVLLWFRSVLIAFDLLAPFEAWLVGFVTAEWQVGAVQISVSRVLALVGIVVGALVLAQLVRIVLEEEIFPRLTLPRGVPGALSMLSRYFIVVLGLLLGLSAAGIDLSTFGLAAGAIGLGLGFGLQNVIANFVSGLILAVERPIQAGDTIEVGKLLGRVSDIGVRSSKVRTFEGAEVIVPNNNLLANDLINWTLSDERRRLDIPVRVAYGSDPHEVIRLLQTVGAGHEEVFDDPPPRAVFEGFGDTSLEFRLLVWVPFGKGLGAKSDLSLGIHDALEAAGISIPVPRRDVRSVEE
jgi:small-conductance mechanosensitive channel